MSYFLKRSLSLMLMLVTLMFALLILEFHASAYDLPPAEEYNQQVEDYVNKIQSTYLVRVKFPMRSDGYYAVGTASLETLDKTLSYMSSEFVKKLSLYYKDNYGDYLTFEFVYLNNSNIETDPAALGMFTSKNTTIQLLIPSSNFVSTMSGCSPITILHELGHAYNLYLSNTYSYPQIYSRWTNFNGGYQYSTKITKNPDKYTFISVYAATGFEEDFADTFAYMFSSNRAGLGIADRLYKLDGKPTNLGMKINYLENSVNNFLDKGYEFQKNIDTMRTTPSTIMYSNILLGGNSLEYIGFNPPYGVLENVLNCLKIVPIKSQWIYEIGGWKVWDNAGGVYFVFPGAKYVTVKIPGRNTDASLLPASK